MRDMKIPATITPSRNRRIFLLPNAHDKMTAMRRRFRRRRCRRLLIHGADIARRSKIQANGDEAYFRHRAIRRPQHVAYAISASMPTIQYPALL